MTREYIADLIDENGNLLQFTAFKEKFGIRGTFLDYWNLLAKIPNVWKEWIANNRPFCILNRFNVFCNEYVKQVIKDKKRSRRFYDVLKNASEIIRQNKWERELGEVSNYDRMKYNSVITELKEVALKDFQFKINNKILVTKYFLRRIGKIDENNCSYCNEHQETIFHLFIECAKIKQFWQQLKGWLSRNVNLTLNLDNKTSLFSYHNNNKLLSFIIVVAKQYIYKKR